MTRKSWKHPVGGGATAVGAIALLGAVAGAAWAQGQSPAAEYSHLLNVRCDERNGNLTVDRLLLVAPPEAGAAVELVLGGPDGKVLRRLPLDVQRWPALPGFAGLVPHAGAVLEHPSREGEFVLAVRVGADVITSLPYTLREVLSGDSYSIEPSVFVREGAWQSLAYLVADPAAPAEALELRWWASEREMPGGWGNTRAFVRVVRGEEEVATGTGVTVVSAADWQPLAAPLARPATAGGGPFTLADLVAADGEYTIAVEARKGVLKRFVATVKGGALQRLDSCRPEPQAGPCPLSPKLVDTKAGRESGYRALDAYWLAVDQR
jgi:hypothetical protein